MTLYEFHGAGEGDQAEAVNNGTFLADRQENGLVVQLFAVSDFYVERYYDPSANQILRFRAFKSQEQLKPYLAHIRFNTH